MARRRTPMRRIAASLMVLVVLGGCGVGRSTGQWIFEKSGATEAEVKRDRSECFAESVDNPNPDVGGWIRVNREAYRACMERRGYSLRVSEAWRIRVAVRDGIAN
jgi:hypothetical protein